jgi:thiamine biosynthesis lipoprotein
VSRLVRRARPLLGTIVEIAAWGGCVEKAFRAIEALQRRLSFHDPASELSMLNSRAHLHDMEVGNDLWRVLRAALALAEESGGAFDVALDGSHRDIALLPGRRVRFARRMRIDLGGIAKGYCVDRAVETLRRSGARAGLVNAGGDLRAFGARSFPIELRHPASPSHTLPWRPLRNAALATSASYGDGAPARWAGGSRLERGLSVTVKAPCAMLADALTKIVRTPRAERVLARHRAQAWVLCATAA